MHSHESGSFNAATTWNCVPADKKTDFQRCQYENQSRIHTTNCQNNVLTGLTCTSD